MTKKLGIILCGLLVVVVCGSVNSEQIAGNAIPQSPDPSPQSDVVVFPQLGHTLCVVCQF